MSAITHRPVQQAMEQLKGLSADDEMRRLAFVRERALHDEVSFTNAAREEGRALGREEGREEGLEQGLEKGREEGQLKLLERQLQRKFGSISDDVRARLNKATAAELSVWAENILFANTLDEVFQ